MRRSTIAWVAGLALPLTAKPEEFRIKPPSDPQDRLDVAGAKTVEMFHEGLKAVQFH